MKKRGQWQERVRWLRVAFRYSKGLRCVAVLSPLASWTMYTVRVAMLMRMHVRGQSRTLNSPGRGSVWEEARQRDDS